MIFLFLFPEESVVLKIAAADYMGKIAGDGNVKLYVKCTVVETRQSYATQDAVELRKPKLTVTVRRKTSHEKRGIGEEKDKGWGQERDGERNRNNIIIISLFTLRFKSGLFS